VMKASLRIRGLKFLSSKETPIFTSGKETDD